MQALDNSTMPKPLPDGRGSVSTIGQLPTPSRNRKGAVAPLVLLLTATAAFAQWPQFRGNPQLTGVTTEKLSPNLKLLWTFEGGESIESSAAIVDGVVYVGAQSGELFAV